VDQTVNLIASAPGPVTTADKPWLRGNSGAMTYTADPTSHATFGIFKSADEFICETTADINFPCGLCGRGGGSDLHQ
jgi:hypothetical protein